MTRGVLLWAICLLVSTGCAGSLQAPSASSPTLTVVVLRKDVTTSPSRPLGADEQLGAKEEVTLDLRVDRPAYVSVILYAPEGTSEDLAGNGTRLIDGQPLLVKVPRRAPQGVKEAELRLVLVASVVPLSPTLRQLLRLPCSVQGRRGDPEKPPKESRPTEPERPPKPDSGKPPAGGPRGGDSAVATCADSPGLTSPTTVRTLVLRSE